MNIIKEEEKSKQKIQHCGLHNLLGRRTLEMEELATRFGNDVGGKQNIYNSSWFFNCFCLLTCVNASSFKVRKSYFAPGRAPAWVRDSWTRPGLLACMTRPACMREHDSAACIRERDWAGLFFILFSLVFIYYLSILVSFFVVNFSFSLIFLHLCFLFRLL